MAKKRAAKTAKDPVQHGADDAPVGPGNPPKEYRWKPGQSGNPKGQPKHRTNLWTWFTKYMAMTDAELAKLDQKELTAAQQTALNLVRKAQAGEGCGAERLARYIVDREEGKAVEHLIIGDESDLTDEECEQVRQLIRSNLGRDSHE